ncbi:MAG: class I SAM-dependent methyltransferase [Candidatus Binatia bacterium]
MPETLTPEKWGRKESAEWWSSGQAARQQIYGAATEMMLDLAGVEAGSRVLDVAAGTGESALMAARRVGSKGHVLAADVSASMLDVAAEAARKEGLTNVETRVMNAEKLELDTDSFDAVVCRVALMLFPNPTKALSEMRRVVKPEAKVAVMVYAGLEKNPFWKIFHKTARRLGNIPPPAPGEPWMFALGEAGALEEVYSQADLLNVSVRAVPILRRSPSAVAAVENMRKGTGDIREVMNRLNEADRERAWSEIAEQFKQFEGPNGLEIPGEMLVGVGTK